MDYSDLYQNLTDFGLMPNPKDFFFMPPRIYFCFSLQQLENLDGVFLPFTVVEGRKAPKR